MGPTQALSLDPFTVGAARGGFYKGKNVLRCDFQNIEVFMGVIQSKFSL